MTGALYLPFFAFFAIFRLYPIIYALILSFQEWMGIGPRIYVGLDNFARIFNDRIATVAITNTVFMAGGELSLSVPIALGLALLVNNQNLRFKGFFRAAFFVPRVIAIAGYKLRHAQLRFTDHWFN